MGYQQIRGIKVTPIGVANRHTTNKAAYWDKTGYAFGGWIYNTQLDVSYSEQPTTISLDIALDTQTITTPNTTNTLHTNSTDAGIGFDIVSGDLNAGYHPTNGENYYTIAVGDNIYTPMYLTSYDIQATSDSKMLKAKFVDYSIVLDKIYVGLFKRQGYRKNFVKKLKSNPTVDAICPDCSLSGVDYWHVTGTFTGSIEFGNYFFNHHGAHDLLPPTTIVTPATRVVSYSNYFEARKNAHTWMTVDPISTEATKFNINGGTFIIGCEEFNESACGDLAPVSYNFSELILGLSKAGMRISQVGKSILCNSWNAHISGQIDKNPNYRNNYIGTLREVLNSWCSDFALDFYIIGKTLCFIDLALGVFPSVNDLRSSMIPNKAGSLLGPQFNSDKNFAIGSYTEKVDMSDTYEQKIITFDARPRKSEDRTKDIKNQCGFIAMHPLDFLGANERVVTNGHKTMYGETFSSPYILNPIWDATPTTIATSLKDMPFSITRKLDNNGVETSAYGNNYFSSAGGCYRSHWYTTRPYILIDICAALGKYSKPLRDIFLGGLIASKLKEQSDGGLSPSAFVDRTLELRTLLNSFGFIPLAYLREAEYSDFKQSFIENDKIYNKKTSDNRQNYILNSANFEIAIGFHTEQEEREIFEWEQSIAENMYKYGVLTRGNLKKQPFLTPNRTDQPSFLAGLTGLSGLKVTKIDSTTEPPSEKYIDFFELPFKDIYQTSGEYNNPIATNMNWSGLSIAELVDNQWGTVEDDFDQKLKVLSPRLECDNFKQGSFKDTVQNAYESPGGFSLEDFAPRFFEMTDDLFEELEDNLRNAVANNPAAEELLGKLIEVKKEKKTQVGGTVPTYTQYKCPKLKLMVIPNVSNFQTRNARVMATVRGVSTVISDLSPHLQVDFAFGKGKNPVMAASLNKMLEKRRIAKLKDLPKNACDTNLTTEICNIGKPILNGKITALAHPARPYGVPNLTTDCRVYSNNPTMANVNGCQCVSEYTGEYSFGFYTGRLLSQDNCRAIAITLLVNPAAKIGAYLPATSYLTSNSKGHIAIVSDDEDFPTFTEATTTLNIYYPVQSAPLPEAVVAGGGSPAIAAWGGGPTAVAPPTTEPFYNYYSGVLTTNVTVQVRSPEIVEIYGDYWSGFSNVAKIEQINNEVDQDIQQQIDPTTKGFFKPVYDMMGNRISSVSGYHKLVSGMSKNSNISPNLSLSFEIVGDAAQVTNFKNALTPASGLSSFSYSLGQEGYRSSVAFASRPKKLPKREAILNKIRPRL